LKVSTTTTPARTSSFPETGIRDRIRQFWNEQTADEADNPFVPETKNTLHEMVPDIDSLEIVRFMLRIEEIIDLEVPPKFIKRGGYETADEMIGHLMPQLSGLWNENHK
jgi:acyl carrier protein